MEYWNDGFIWIGITLIEVGGASACNGLEAEGQESLASCLRSFVPQDKLSAPEAKVLLFVFGAQYSIIPTFHQSIGPLFQLVSQ